jgi:hypothetical protein
MGQRELVRHYTLSAVDIAMIRRRRGDHSRLGHALMLCYLRHPGGPLRANERPPSTLVSFVAEQIDVLPESTAGYLASEQNRRRHAAELQDRLLLRPFGTGPAAHLASWLLPHAIDNDRRTHLARLVVEECRRRRIIIPSPGALERAIDAQRQAENVPDQLLAHLTPFGWEHVNLTGDYIWSAELPATEYRDDLRPLRAALDAACKAA